VNDLQPFAGLPEAELRGLVAAARRRRFDSGEVVFHRGDPADSLHLIVKGRFVARAITQLGDTVAFAIHSPGEAFGELALVEPGGVRSSTVAALESGETLAISRDVFDTIRREHPEVNEVLVRLLAARLRRSSDRLLEALFAPAEIRVLRRLRELGELYRRSSSVSETVIPLNQEDIAALAGTSRATANRILRAEEKRGTIRLSRGRTHILDPEDIARRAHFAALDRV
jgi:CRP/FNR family cyclic AMP-dependent transcriptional regulator